MSLLLNLSAEHEAPEDAAGLEATSDDACVFFVVCVVVAINNHWCAFGTYCVNMNTDADTERMLPGA